MSNERFGLSEDTIRKILSVLNQHTHIDETLIYGSRALGVFRNGSDIDLCLKGDKIDLQELNHISQELDNLDLPYQFDITACHMIDNDDLLDHINRVGVKFS